MFLRERDRARLRGDLGVQRSLTADLRRLGVPDDATLADPSGKQRRNGAEPKAEEETPRPAKRGGRPAKARCEHGVIAERCAECNEELLAS
jgi:hypothetical protein